MSTSADSLPSADQLEPWIRVEFERSGGPGGQNVNKLNTRVSLLFDFRTCPLLSDAQRQRIATRLSRRLAEDGRLRIVSQRTRSQAANRADALARLIELLTSALHTPRKRIATAPTRAARERRLDSKAKKGAIKAARGRVHES